jgi:hypothetical protein
MDMLEPLKNGELVHFSETSFTVVWNETRHMKGWCSWLRGFYSVKAKWYHTYFLHQSFMKLSAISIK